MKLRYLAAVALGVALGALPAPAQSVAEQLQKGIYAQQTAGDLDGAIRIYRQVIASNPAQRIYAAQAQMHLAQALLAKGDLEGAAQEFTTLSANYSEFRDMIADMASRMQEASPATRWGGQAHVFSLGTVTLSQGEPDHYQHNLTGVELTAPAGWSLAGDGAASGGAEMVKFSISDIRTDALAVWLKPAAIKEADIAGWLRGALARKGQDRAGLAGWKVRPESVQTRVVGGQQALSAIADYTEAAFQVDSALQTGNGTIPNSPTIVTSHTINSDKMVEYPIWVRSTKTHVVFFGRAKSTDLAALQSGMDELAATAVIP
jgi:tetratricopeptide (TPR) repeat protein